MKTLEIKWIGKQEPTFDQDVSAALHKLRFFLTEQGFGQLSLSGLMNIEHFETKASFDSELIKLSKGQMKIVPKTFVAIGDQRVLRIVSREAFKSIFPGSDQGDYVRLLTHEMAHIFHSELVGDTHMGPVWFFEGFAIVASDQYLDVPSLALSEIRNIVRSTNRGDYAAYGFILRKIMKTHPIKDLVEKAKMPEAKFLEWLEY